MLDLSEKNMVYIMRIAILCRLGKPYDDVETSKRPWLKHLSQEIVDPETSIYYYIKKYYPEITVHKYTINTIHRLDHKKYDYVFNLFFDLTLLFHSIMREEKNANKWNRFIGKYNSIDNLVPSNKIVYKFFTPKCTYLNWLKKNGFPIIPTKCIEVKTQSKTRFRTHFPTSKIKFVKPAPSGETKNANIIYYGNVSKINKYFNKIKTIGYNKILIQNFLEDFASAKSPEMRTYWVGTKYMYTVETIDRGVGATVRKKKLPPSVYKQSIEIIEKLNKKFNTHMILTRIDWGFVNNKYFINEIEYAPGVFSELFGNTAKDWTLDQEMCKYIVKLIQTKKEVNASIKKLFNRTEI